MQISTRVGVVQVMAFSLSTATFRRLEAKISASPNHRKGGGGLRRFLAIGDLARAAAAIARAAIWHHANVIGYLAKSVDGGTGGRRGTSPRAGRCTKLRPPGAAKSQQNGNLTPVQISHSKAPFGAAML